jgi:hypothetical protein
MENIGGKIKLYLWRNFHVSLANGPAEWVVASKGLRASDDSLTVLWCLAYLDLNRYHLPTPGMVSGFIEFRGRTLANKCER